jgi:hypothetical protein
MALSLDCFRNDRFDFANIKFGDHPISRMDFGRIFDRTVFVSKVYLYSRDRTLSGDSADNDIRSFANRWLERYVLIRRSHAATQPHRCRFLFRTRNPSLASSIKELDPRMCRPSQVSRADNHAVCRSSAPAIHRTPLGEERKKHKTINGCACPL